MRDRNDGGPTGPQAAKRPPDEVLGPTYDAGRVLTRPRAPDESAPDADRDEAATAARIHEWMQADGRLAGADVRVRVTGAVAELEGSVADEAQRRIAAEIAAGAPGIERVDNRLRIDVPPPPTAD